MELGVTVRSSNEFRSHVYSTKRHQKKQVDNSSIFHRFWKLNRRWVVLVELMSFSRCGLFFSNQWNIDRLSMWSFCNWMFCNFFERYLGWFQMESVTLFFSQPFTYQVSIFDSHWFSKHYLLCLLETIVKMLRETWTARLAMSFTCVWAKGFCFFSLSFILQT